MKKTMSLLLSTLVWAPACVAHVTFEILPGKTLTLKQGDITQESVDVIVNAANPQLQAGQGVCGAIFKAAGKYGLQRACNEHPIVEASDVRCPFGQSRITESFALSKQGVNHIIHTAGPDCRIIKNEQTQDRLLEKAYINSLQLADAYHQKSIAFPFISSAIYAFPADRASLIAIRSVVNYLKTKPDSKLTDVRFILFSESDYDLFFQVASQMLTK